MKNDDLNKINTLLIIFIFTKSEPKKEKLVRHHFDRNILSDSLS